MKRVQYINHLLLAFLFLLYMITACYSSNPGSVYDLSELKISGINFTENKGQIIDGNHNLRPDILYVGDGGGMKVYLRKSGISYVLSKTTAKKDEEKVLNERTGMENEIQQITNIHLHRIDLDFVDCNSNITILRDNEAQGYSNYYYGHCPKGITNVHSYNRVVYQNVFPNIDFVFYGGKKEGLKYDIIVKPGGDPNNIKLKYSGADELEITNGELKIKNSIAEITENIPKVYQNINGKVIEIKTEYILHGTTLNFKLGTFNSAFSLVIDPWATYFGGNKSDYSTGIATDNAGNTVISGYTLGGTFPVGAAGASVVQQSAFGGMVGLYDAFIVKFDPAGALQWATFYGGDQDDRGMGIATDNGGNVLVTGYTGGGTFPTGSTGANIVQQAAYGGGSLDAFVVKFNVLGAMQWATFYGGDQKEEAYGIAIDNLDNPVITGHTGGGTFPIGFTGGNVVQQAAYGGALWDVFVVKFNSTGAMQWATYCGGDKIDLAYAIAIDNANNPVITGSSQGGTFPVGFTGANVVHQAVYGGGPIRDIIVVKYNSIGVRQWATFLGGAVNEAGNAIATDNNGNVVITGWNLGAGFPVAATAGNVMQQSVSGGSSDAIVAKFDPTGVMLWATYYGTNQPETGFGITIDLNNNIYMLMEAEDVSTPSLVDPCSYQTLFNAGFGSSQSGGPPEDQLLVKFKPNGEKTCASYLGGRGEDDLDNGAGITINGNSLFITGATDGGYPVTPGVAQTAYAGPNTFFYSGGSDVFVTSICANICEGPLSLGLSITTDTNNVCSNVPINYSFAINNSCDTTGYLFQWTFTGGTPSSSSARNPAIFYNASGNHTAKVVVTTPCKKDSVSQSKNITVINNVNTSGSQNICQGQSVSIHGASQSIAGVYTQTFAAAIGCDSISAITLVVNSISSSTVNPNACSSYIHNAQTYTITGVYSQTLTNLGGCDSVLSINLTIGSPINTSGSQNICQGQSIPIHGINQSTPGIYSQTFVATGGCDSISAISLAVNSISNNTVTVNACNSYTLNGQSYSSNGIYTQTLANAMGCDSLLTLDLTISNIINTNGNQSVCLGQSVLIHGINQSTPGVYTQTFALGGGCDSVSAITLLVKSISSSTVNPNACNNYTHNAQTYAASGIYTQTLTNASGCDSILTINLTISTAPSSNGNIDICQGQIASIHGINQTIAGLYTQTYTAANGCDSVSSITLTVFTIPIANIGADSTIIAGQGITISTPPVAGSNYQWSTGEITATINVHPTITSTYVLLITDSDGCTATDTITVFVEKPCNDNTEVFVPNSFSPNGDGQNDVLKLYSTGSPEIIYFAIYDRWGEKVFESNDIAAVWDGRYKNRLEDTAVFAYLLKISCKGSTEENVKKGNISLLR